MAIPNFEQRLYGNNLPRDEEIDALADQLLTPAQKAALEEEGGDKRRSWLKVILLLLASPVLIAGGIGVAAMPMMSGAISGER